LHDESASEVSAINADKEKGSARLKRSVKDIMPSHPGYSVSMETCIE
jgi:hypothetical protein